MNIGKFIFLIFSLGLSFFSAQQETVSFEGYKIVSLKPTGESHLKLINDLQINNADFDVLNNIRKLNENVYVVLSPNDYIKYKQIFDDNHMECKIINDNYQDSINAEKESMEKMRKRDANGKITTRFNSYSEINNFMFDIAEKHSFASTFTAGTTFENRAIFGLILKHTPAPATRGLFIDCGIHAREWIAVSSCIWFIDHLVENYAKGDQKSVDLLKKYEIHIIPLLNPDGYEFSRNSNRQWRKNRRTNSGSTCIGVDLNRNFGFQWGVAGSSNLPCSDVYRGPSADSELETQALERQILAKPGFWDAYLTIHTYGNYWLSSWSYSATIYPPDFTELLAQSNVGANAIKTIANSQYTTGHSGVLFGALSGVSDDWAKGTAGVKFSYTLELAPGSGDSDHGLGFVLPPEKIPQVGKELTAGIYEFCLHPSTTVSG